MAQLLFWFTLLPSHPAQALSSSRDVSRWISHTSMLSVILLLYNSDRFSLIRMQAAAILEFGVHIGKICQCSVLFLSNLPCHDLTASVQLFITMLKKCLKIARPLEKWAHPDTYFLSLCIDLSLNDLLPIVTGPLWVKTCFSAPCNNSLGL